MDALVALTILSLTIVLSLAAVQQANRTARAASEIQDARLLMAQLDDTQPKTFDGTAGSSAAFHWTVQTQPTGADALVNVCRRAVDLVSRDARRRYSLATLTTCPPTPATP